MEALSEREIEVIKLLASGLTNPEIAKELFITKDTVGTHVSHILSKLGAKTRSQAVAIWMLQQQRVGPRKCIVEGCRLPALPLNSYCPIHKLKAWRER